MGLEPGTTKQDVIDSLARWNDGDNGILDLSKFVETLKKVNFTGPLVIEYEGDEKNPVPALRECVKKLQPLM